MDRPSGMVFIGDPHITARRPRCRVDADFLGVSLGKLRQAVDLASEMNLVPVILGDLFDRPWENAPELLGGVLSIFASARHRPFVLRGNHDCRESRLHPRTSLGIVRASGLATVIDETVAFVVDFRHGRALLGGTPYGEAIPERVDRKGCDIVFWITHEDMAFAGCYPGAREFFEIAGCDHVVNGHMHMSAESVRVGMTHWHNPGNILRLTSPEARRPVQVLAWRESEFETFPLECNTEAFVPNVRPTGQAAETNAVRAREFNFVKAITEEVGGDRVRTDDAGHFRALIEQVARETNVSAEAMAVISSLIEQTLDVSIGGTENRTR